MSIQPNSKHSLVELTDGSILYNNTPQDIEVDTRGANIKFWFNNNTLMYKETLDCFYYGNDIEVLISRLLTKAGLDCAKYSIADYKNKDNIARGVITENYRMKKAGCLEEVSGNSLLEAYAKSTKKPSSFVNGANNTVKTYLLAVATLFPETDLTKLKQDMLKLSLADYLVTQTDRHSRNISFLRVDNKIELASIFDNSFAFISLEQDKFTNVLKRLTCYNEDEKDHFIDSYSSINMPILGISSPVDKSYDYVPMQEKSELNSFTDKCVCEYLSRYEKELANEIIKDSELAEIFQNFQSINIAEFIKELNTTEDTMFNDEVINWICSIYQCRMNILSKTIEKQKSELDIEIQR